MGERANFQCNHSIAHNVGWIVNDTTLSVLNNQDITTTTVPLSGGGLLHKLTILAQEEYNHTTFKCLAFIDRAPSELSPQAELLVQGINYGKI